MFHRKYDEHSLDIDETIVTELLEHDNLKVLCLKYLKRVKSDSYPFCSY